MPASDFTFAPELSDLIIRLALLSHLFRLFSIQNPLHRQEIRLVRVVRHYLKKIDISDFFKKSVHFLLAVQVLSVHEREKNEYIYSLTLWNMNKSQIYHNSQNRINSILQRRKSPRSTFNSPEAQKNSLPADAFQII